MTSKLEFRNYDLVPVGNLLGSLKLKNMASLGRSKLIKLIVAKNEDYQNDLNEIREQYFQKDENGEFKADQDKKLIYKDPTLKDECTMQIKTISDDKAIIPVTEYVNKFKKLYEALQKYDGEFSDQNALVYEVIMDAFDKCFAKKGEEE